MTRRTKISICLLVAALSSFSGWPPYCQDTRERAGGASPPPEKSGQNALVYGKTSSGRVGTYYNSLSIDKSGHAVLRGGRVTLLSPTRGETQLTTEELDALARAIHQANFPHSRKRYGRHAVVNEKSLLLSYYWNGKQANALWDVAAGGAEAAGWMVPNRRSSRPHLGKGRERSGDP